MTLIRNKAFLNRTFHILLISKNTYGCVNYVYNIDLKNIINCHRIGRQTLGSQITYVRNVSKLQKYSNLNFRLCHFLSPTTNSHPDFLFCINKKWMKSGPRTWLGVKLGYIKLLNVMLRYIYKDRLGQDWLWKLVIFLITSLAISQFC